MIGVTLTFAGLAEQWLAELQKMMDANIPDAVVYSAYKLYEASKPQSAATDGSD